MNRLFLLSLVVTFSCIHLPAQEAKHSFALKGQQFLLDGKPFRIISGEMHPARIPREYWRHRIRMAKAMGCNTISAYLFWNFYEYAPGHFDFSSGNRDIAAFIRIVKEEGMWLLLRPGPYACAEWDFGGLPPYLLSIPDIKIRCMDSRYMEAVSRYIDTLAPIIRQGLCTHGGPVLMLQVENEYGSYGNDRAYMKTLRNMWLSRGIDVPFNTADGPTPYMLEAGSLDSCAVGLDSGGSPADFMQARLKNQDAPSFSSETYPGWLTHWGEKWAKVKTSDLLPEVRFLLDSGKSFSFYVVHGGTNFGFSAGANSGGKGYEPDITSYDYDAPISEQGLPTEKYFALRQLISQYSGPLPAVPEPIPAIDIPAIPMHVYTSVWEHLPASVPVVQPEPMEAFNQFAGFIMYRTRLIGQKSGKLLFTDLHDFGLVIKDGQFEGTVDRRLGENSVNLPSTGNKDPQLDVFVEAMGHINFAQQMIDRKGITERASLNGMTLMHWEVFNLPFDSMYIQSLTSSLPDTSRRLLFFRGTFSLNRVADTWFDLGGYKKGILFVNGRNLGRFWNIGPQYRLYCPASWLHEGMNEILVFDLLQTSPAPIAGFQKAQQ